MKGFRDFFFLQASIREAAIANVGSMCSDGHADSKGKDRHDTDGSLSLGLGEGIWFIGLKGHAGEIAGRNNVRPLFLLLVFFSLDS